MARSVFQTDIQIPAGTSTLPGLLAMPSAPSGLVVFVHGSGSSRLSPRNMLVARELQAAGFATFLFDLLTEDEAQNRTNVFDITFLANRLLMAVDWLARRRDIQALSIGLFGASTGAAAALTAAARQPQRFRAVISRGGRPDLADAFLPRVSAPTLLIVGEADTDVLRLNRAAFAKLVCAKALKVVPDATHLFEEPGTLDMVIDLACAWFKAHLVPPRPSRPEVHQTSTLSPMISGGKMMPIP
jgi:putative phosphoribosyl transferase